MAFPLYFIPALALDTFGLLIIVALSGGNASLSLLVLEQPLHGMY